MTTLSGPLSVVASEEMGELGSGESEPAVIDWHWYYHVPSFSMWALPLVLLIVLPENRTRQTWMILIPVIVLTVFVWPLLARLLSFRSLDAERYGIQFDALVASWASVWLLGGRLSRWNRLVSFSTALALMLLVGAAALYANYGYWSGFRFLEYSVPAAALVLAMSLSACCCRKGFCPVRFLAWLALWLFVGMLVGETIEIPTWPVGLVT